MKKLSYFATVLLVILLLAGCDTNININGGVNVDDGVNVNGENIGNNSQGTNNTDEESNKDEENNKGNEGKDENTSVEVESLSLSETEAVLGVGESKTLSVNLLPDNATDKAVTWESTKPDVATVENGVVTAVSEGAATILVRSSNGKFAVCTITVNSAEIAVGSIALDKSSLSIEVGKFANLVVIVSPEDATDKSITWKSSNPEIASVNNGIVFAVSDGTATVTARSVDGKTAACEVTVYTFVATENINLDKTSLYLFPGESETVIATVSPENATEKTVTWESLDASVATVVNGKITAVGVGETQIIARINDTVYSACNINVLSEDSPKYSYTWGKTDIRMELTNNTNNDELSSGCARYYAGTAANAFDPIDTLVRNRNLAAAKQANVTLKVDYVRNTSEYGWGANIDRIATAAASTDSNYPDIYCNFVYDLTCAQLRGCFANLKDTTRANGNFFRFTEPDYNLVSDNYFDAEAGEGYFYDYMQSLSLSDDKMYCLASNYTIDVMRASLVIPVNIQMLHYISAEDSWTGDMQDYNDFYDLVWKDEERVKQNDKYGTGWTYDVLAHYSKKIYSQVNGSATALDDVLGFIAGRTSGLVSSGLLYSSGVKIITKTPSGNNDGTYTYAYPEKNDELNAYAAAITKLFREGTEAGIATVTGVEAKAYDANAGTELLMIRNKFAKNEVLFGGVICVGSLEDTIYQNMRVDGEGFGIVPVPTYKEGDEYLTLVHNLARVITIAAGSSEFSQCSAYLDYVSRMSAEVIDTYYNDILAGAAGGIAAAQNSRMLTYIRNHVRDCFDKTYEDVVAYKYSAEVGGTAATASKWHEILGNKNGFIYDSFATDYLANREAKEKNLLEVVAEWNSKT